MPYARQNRQKQQQQKSGFRFGILTGQAGVPLDLLESMSPEALAKLGGR